MEQRRQYLTATLVVLIMILGVMSMAFIYSASFTVGIRRFQNGHHFIVRHVIWYVFGFGVMLFTSRVHYRFYKKHMIYFLMTGIVILSAVLLFGTEINGAKRWIRIGSMSAQPAEFAKILFIMWFAGFLDNFRSRKKEDLDILIPAMIVTGIYIFLIFLEKDMSTSLHLFTVAFIMLTVSNIKLIYMFSLFFVMSSGGAVLIGKSEFRRNRVLRYIDGLKTGIPKGHQVKQSLIGIGNGGITGLGFGNGLQKYYYLPELHTDFIFSVIAEEMGILGPLILIFSYIGLLFIGVKTVFITKDFYGKYLALGITSLVTVQVLINMMVATGLIPATGIPLPLISSGGSSIVTLMAAMGILLNIIKEGDKK